jgi:hypothetical protein
VEEYNKRLAAAIVEQKSNRNRSMLIAIVGFSVAMALGPAKSGSGLFVAKMLSGIGGLYGLLFAAVYGFSNAADDSDNAPPSGWEDIKDLAG